MNKKIPKDKLIKLQNYLDLLLGDSAVFILFDPKNDYDEIANKKTRRPNFIFSKKNEISEYNKIDCGYMNEYKSVSEKSYFIISDKNIEGLIKIEPDLISNFSQIKPTLYCSMSNIHVSIFPNGRILFSHRVIPKKQKGDIFLKISENFDFDLKTEEYEILKKIKKRNLDSINEPKIKTILDKWKVKQETLNNLESKELIEKRNESSYKVSKLGLLVIYYFGLQRLGSVKNSEEAKQKGYEISAYVKLVKKENEKFVPVTSKEEFDKIADEWKNDLKDNLKNTKITFEYKFPEVKVDLLYQDLEKFKTYTNKKYVRNISFPSSNNGCQKFKIKVDEVRYSYL